MRPIGFKNLSSKNLPYDAEIEYLESPGYCAINTNIVPLKSDVTECDFIIRNNGKTWLFGVTDSWLRNGYSFGYGDVLPGHLRCSFGTGSDGGPTDGCSVAANVKTHLKFTDGRIYLDGVLKSDMNNRSYSQTRPLHLFCELRGGNLSEYAAGGRVLYNFNIQRNGEYILQMIPVRKDGVGYMYDKVSGQFFGNLGTGNFILGPDK